ncbi:MAG: hypothetical protein DRP29_09835 [Thermodesulfobacteriota bacterium]|nr:MAG: hypothetical protein DRP29_09835 [Thermodesulfobacteriota bacterium]
MKDRPDFTKPIAFALQEIPVDGRRDYAAIAEEVKEWQAELVANLNPGVSLSAKFYTVPSGQVLYLTEFCWSTYYRGYSKIAIDDTEVVFDMTLDSCQTQKHHLELPKKVFEGHDLYYKTRNQDIVYAESTGILKAFTT